MVYLSRIYTRTGDAGLTALGDGTRLAKCHSRVEAYGEVDELNAVLGLLLVHAPTGPHVMVVQGVQNDLFDLGADLCMPEKETPTEHPPLRVVPEQVARLEQAIDQFNASLEPLHSFILPGGSAAAAWLHLARTVCRRAERRVVTLMQSEPVNEQVLIYLNRLSDLLFVLSRMANQHAPGDVLWVPGKSRAPLTEPPHDGG